MAIYYVKFKAHSPSGSEVKCRKANSIRPIGLAAAAVKIKECFTNAWFWLPCSRHRVSTSSFVLKDFYLIKVYAGKTKVEF